MESSPFEKADLFDTEYEIISVSIPGIINSCKECGRIIKTKMHFTCVVYIVHHNGHQATQFPSIFIAHKAATGFAITILQ